MFHWLMWISMNREEVYSMSSYIYQSSFAPYFEDFEKAKATVGFDTLQFRKFFKELDVFVIQYGFIEITRELVSKWRDTHVNDSNRTLYGKYCVLGQFAKYLNHRGIKAYVPMLPKQQFDSGSPYIFTHEQIKKIFEVADSLRMPCSNKSNCLFSIPAILRVLYSTGMRIGEVLSLENRDVNLEQNRIIVRITKNKQEKLIPINSSLHVVLSQYYKYKCHIVNANLNVQLPNAPFFCSLMGKPMVKVTVFTWFKRILMMCGIPHIGGGKGPHIHHLRHTFAVHSLQQQVKSGADIYCAMPILSIFLGHKDLRGTERYVRLTHEMYPDVIAAQKTISEEIYPQPISSTNNED